MDVDSEMFNQIPNAGLYWIDTLNFQIDGTGTIYYIKDFTKYTYTSQAHFLSYGYTLGDIISLTSGEFTSATNKMPYAGARP